MIRVGDTERNRRLIGSRPAPDVHDHPEIRELKVSRRIAVTSAQDASAEHLLVVTKRPIDIGHGEKMRDADPLLRRHLIVLLFDVYRVHWYSPFSIRRSCTL